eukprot:TRINITY_DN30759_c0_g1_i1.p1 TRINITY_DN30759_c0_g1~~TRINITY_DN30759_c0_g1_i1.p1  ORF type:complete len:958 (+),score=176.08 TRINITY_DN30759_c0_g1_i1:106-2979(+)
MGRWAAAAAAGLAAAALPRARGAGGLAYLGAQGLWAMGMTGAGRHLAATHQCLTCTGLAHFELGGETYIVWCDTSSTASGSTTVTVFRARVDGTGAPAERLCTANKNLDRHGAGGLTADSGSNTSTSQRPPYVYFTTMRSALAKQGWMVWRCKADALGAAAEAMWNTECYNSWGGMLAYSDATRSIYLSTTPPLSSSTWPEAYVRRYDIDAPSSSAGEVVVSNIALVDDTADVGAIAVSDANSILYLQVELKSAALRRRTHLFCLDMSQPAPFPKVATLPDVLPGWEPFLDYPRNATLGVPALSGQPPVFAVSGDDPWVVAYADWQEGAIYVAQADNASFPKTRIFLDPRGSPSAGEPGVGPVAWFPRETLQPTAAPSAPPSTAAPSGLPSGAPTLLPTVYSTDPPSAAPAAVPPPGVPPPPTAPPRAGPGATAAAPPPPPPPRAGLESSSPSVVTAVVTTAPGPPPPPPLSDETQAFSGPVIAVSTIVSVAGGAAGTASVQIAVLAADGCLEAEEGELPWPMHPLRFAVSGSYHAGSVLGNTAILALLAALHGAAAAVLQRRAGAKRETPRALLRFPGGMLLPVFALYSALLHSSAWLLLSGGGENVRAVIGTIGFLAYACAVPVAVWFLVLRRIPGRAVYEPEATPPTGCRWWVLGRGDWVSAWPCGYPDALWFERWGGLFKPFSERRPRAGVLHRIGEAAAVGILQGAPRRSCTACMALDGTAAGLLAVSALLVAAVKPFQRPRDDCAYTLIPMLQAAAMLVRAASRSWGGDTCSAAPIAVGVLVICSAAVLLVSVMLDVLCICYAQRRSRRSGLFTQYLIREGLWHDPGDPGIGERRGSVVRELSPEDFSEPLRMPSASGTLSPSAAQLPTGRGHTSASFTAGTGRGKLSSPQVLPPLRRSSHSASARALRAPRGGNSALVLTPLSVGRGGVASPVPGSPHSSRRASSAQYSQ